MLTEKYCGGCRQTKPVSEWYPNPTKKDGLGTQCKACAKAFVVEYRKRPAVKAAELARGRSSKRKTQRCASLLKPLHRAVGLVTSARGNAKRGNLPFNIDISDILPALERGTCDVTGLPFDFTRGLGRHLPFGPSLDKEVPALGYVRGNVRVVCWAYNAARGDWGDDVLKVLVEALVKQWSHSQPSPSTTSSPKCVS